VTLGEKDMEKAFSVSDESEQEDEAEQEKVRNWLLRKETEEAIGKSQLSDILEGVDFNDVSADFQEWLRDEDRSREDRSREDRNR